MSAIPWVYSWGPRPLEVRGYQVSLWLHLHSGLEEGLKPPRKGAQPGSQ